MPDPTSPDPNTNNQPPTPGMSGQQQPQYAQPQMQPPPAGFSVPPHAAYLQPRLNRPVSLTLGTIAAGILAIPFGFHGVDNLSHVGSMDDSFALEGVFYGVAHVMMAFMSVVTVILLATGRDFGRILGSGLAGVEVWFFAGWFFRFIGGAVSGGSETAETLISLYTVAAIIGGIAGITVLVCMSMPAISQYFASKAPTKTSPASAPAAVPPMGPNPT